MAIQTTGNFTLATNATADATINGSVYNYTYTADADNAGNLGESVSRIITIIDAESCQDQYHLLQV